MTSKSPRRKEPTLKKKIRRNKVIFHKTVFVDKSRSIFGLENNI